jgi:DNA transformation protein
MVRKQDSFMQFVMEQFKGIEGIVPRPMFGGYGIYQRGIFFGILYKGRLYFKTDKRSRPAYEAAGMKPFQPFLKHPTAKNRKPMILKNYYEVPPEVLEDRDQFHDWARQSAHPEAP